MTLSLHRSRALAGLLPLALALAACGGRETTIPEIPPLEQPATGGEVAVETAPARESPPPSAAPRDVAFPPVTRSTVGQGLELDVVEQHQLPLVYLTLTVRSGAETDPAELPGLASFVAAMLKEGTRRLSSAALAEEIDFLGAQFDTSADPENVTITFRVVRPQFERAMQLLAEIATQPAFTQVELDKLKRRERDRLDLVSQEPDWLAERAYHAALYGSHPYARTDTTRVAVDRVTRNDLVRWHRTHFVPSNAYLVVVGDVTAADAARVAGSYLGSWRGRPVATATPPSPPTRTAREVLIVDRPGSVQSLIQIGNLAMPRNDDQWIPMMVANQVLGGSASSRLFMDLRERRSLTYGAYSSIDETVQIAPFTASASVRTEVTTQAVAAFFEHLERFVREPAAAEELANAARYLSDSFPLRIATTGSIAARIAELREFGLPDDYWDTYRSRIGTVTAEQALAAARAHVQPDRALVLVVGEAARFEQDLRRYGPVTVVDAEGTVLRRLEATTESPPATTPGSSSGR